MSTTTYTRVPAAEARAGDEIYLADAWHKCKGVFHIGADIVKVTWHSGGSMSGPAHHHMFRRAVPENRPTA
jgi:hypothetical protein